MHLQYTTSVCAHKLKLSQVLHILVYWLYNESMDFYLKPTRLKKKVKNLNFQSDFKLSEFFFSFNHYRD